MFGPRCLCCCRRFTGCDVGSSPAYNRKRPDSVNRSRLLSSSIFRAEQNHHPEDNMGAVLGLCSMASWVSKEPEHGELRTASYTSVVNTTSDGTEQSTAAHRHPPPDSRRTAAGDPGPGGPLRVPGGPLRGIRARVDRCGGVRARVDPGPGGSGPGWWIWSRVDLVPGGPLCAVLNVSGCAEVITALGFQSNPIKICLMINFIKKCW